MYVSSIPWKTENFTARANIPEKQQSAKAE